MKEVSKTPYKKRASRLLLRGAAMNFVAFSANFLAGFLIMPFLIHHLGERGYGFWALIGTIIGQLLVLDAGFMSTTQRFMANALALNDFQDATAIYSTSMAIFWGIAGIVFVSVCIIAASAELWLSSPSEIYEFQVALIISGANLALLFPFAVMQGALAARLRADADTVAQLVCTVVRTSLVFAAIEMGFGIVGLACAALLASLAQRTVLLAMVRRHLPEISFNWSAVTWNKTRELFAFARSVFVVNASDAAQYRLHNLLIAVFSGISAVTHYSVVIRLADYFSALVSRISNVFSPVYSRHFVRGESALLRAKFLSLSRISAIVCCVFATSSIVFGRSFFRLWLGKGFDDSYVALAILMSGMFFALLQNASRSVLRAIYKHAFDAKSNLAEVLCNLLLALLLVPRIGIIGAAIATAGPMIVVKGFVLPIYVCRAIGSSVSVYFVALCRILLPSCVLSVGAAYFLPLDRITGLMNLAVVGIAFASLSAVLLSALLPSADKLSIVDAVGRNRIQKLPGGALFIRCLAG